MIIWVLVAALAGVTFGALWVLVMEHRDPLRLRGLASPISEFQRPAESLFQALWRLPWAIGFMILQSLLWAFAYLVGVTITAGPFIIAWASGIVGLVLLFASLGAMVTGEGIAELVRLFWPIVCTLIYPGAYALSVYVGSGLMEKEKEE